MNIYDALNKELQQVNIEEFEILSLSMYGELTIIGSFDSSYHHELEIYIKNPSYISLPKYFESPTFRLATLQEKKDLEKERLFSKGLDGTVICIELDRQLAEEFDQPFEKHYIIAENFTYKFGLVYHYKRENLEEGERIAEWVK
ncbi:hypothetical protein HZI73_00525 [Vallitalea pronyensis]|uniref:Uncharacterized protein n=1 Tax=Vallitalea pronyensis TaxID=1348613 RepID=A0A8J8SEQ4_9FIRM|nr:hypothetical protein [Vallitalea pronyensis]QUI20785.1 hypothetical protein HZI73_00525 [Vallitalea pronyensis]